MISEKLANEIQEADSGRTSLSRELVNLSAIGALLALFMLVDFYLPPGVPHGMLYVLAILLCTVLTRSKAVLWIAVALTCAAAVAGGIANLHPQLGALAATVTRALSVLIVSLAGMLCHVKLSQCEKIEKTQRSLEDTQRRLQINRALLEVASDTTRFGGFSISFADRKLQVTGDVMAIFGQPPNRAPRFDHILDYYLPPYRDQILAASKLCREQGTPYDMECEILTAQNERRWIRSTGRPDYDAEGKIRGICGSVQDLTPVKMLEQSLVASNTRFRSMASSLPVIVWTANVAGELDFVNGVASERLNLKPEHLAKKSYLKQLMHPEDLRQVLKKWFACVNGGAYEFRSRARLKFADGNYYWHQIDARSNYSLDGQDSESRWFGVATNIDKLVQIKSKQQSMSRLMNKTFESITDIFFTVDLNWKFTYLNTRAAEVFGAVVPHLLGKDFLQIGKAVFGERLLEKLACIEVEGTLDTFEEKIESNETYFRCSAYALDGEGFIFYLQDVTQHQLLEIQLAKAQQSETIGLLTGGIAHDFNNLLTIIMGNAEVMRQKLDPESNLAERTRSIQSAAGRGAKLVKELLAYARNQPLQPEIVDIKELIQGFTNLLRKSLTMVINLKLHHAEDLWYAEVDPFQLENAILNLCMNSMQAMKDGGDILIETNNLTIGPDRAECLQEFSPGDYVTISVSDTGSGIAKDRLEKIFEPFYTTKDAGTGLGLSMVYGFAKQSGGHVTAYSEEGRGTTIRVYLPRAEKGKLPTVAHQPKLLAVGKAEGTILLVDDESLVREYAMSVLEHAGYKVIAAEDGQQALNLLAAREMNFDLLLTDIIMPGGIDGAQLKEKALELYPDIKVLVASGYSAGILNFDLEESNPAVDYIMKPYQRDALLSKVYALLSQTGQEVEEAC